MIALVDIKKQFLLLNPQLTYSARIKKGKYQLNALGIILFPYAFATSHGQD